MSVTIVIPYDQTLPRIQPDNRRISTIPLIAIEFYASTKGVATVERQIGHHLFAIEVPPGEQIGSIAEVRQKRALQRAI